MIIHRQCIEIPTEDLLSLYSKSQLARYIPGGIWNYVGRFTLLKKLGNNGYNIIIQGTVLETALLIVSSLIVGLIFSFGILNTLEIISILLVLVILTILIIKMDTPINLLKRLFKIKYLNFTYIGLDFYLKMFLFYCAMWFLVSFGFAFFSISVLEVNTLQNFFNVSGIFSLSMCFGFVTPMPGGIGTRETALVFLASRLDIKNTAYFIAIASRIALIISEVLSFILITVYSKFYRRKNK